MPLLVPPPTASEYDLHGLPPEALATSLKQEMSNWMRLHESNQEMKMMMQDTIQGKETSEGIRLSTDDVVELQKACTENVDVIERKGALIAQIKDILIEKAGEHAIPAEVNQAEAEMVLILQQSNEAGIDL